MVDRHGVSTTSFKDRTTKEEWAGPSALHLLNHPGRRGCRLVIIYGGIQEGLSGLKPSAEEVREVARMADSKRFRTFQSIPTMPVLPRSFTSHPPMSQHCLGQVMIQLTFTRVDRVSEVPRQIRLAVSQVSTPNSKLSAVFDNRVHDANHLLFQCLCKASASYHEELQPLVEPCFKS